MLDNKLTEIARALGKVDEQGEVTENLRVQLLGQLSERLQYDRLFSKALADTELKRTKWDWITRRLWSFWNDTEISRHRKSEYGFIRQMAWQVSFRII